MLKFSKYHKHEWMALGIWVLLWFGLGTHMNKTFDISSYYLSNFNFLSLYIRYNSCVNKQNEIN